MTDELVRIGRANRIAFAQDLMLHAVHQYKGQPFPVDAVCEDIMLTIGGLTREELVVAVQGLTQDKVHPRWDDGDLGFGAEAS
jgi:hypothetical protein